MSEASRLRPAQALAGCAVLICALLLALAGPSFAASVNYGDFAGPTVMYLDVTETANTPGDSPPLFGPPSLNGDQLEFDPTFSASAGGGAIDLTDGQLNVTLMATQGAALTVIQVSESGTYSLGGVGSAATQIGYGLSLASVTVLEVDGIALVAPVALAAASVSGTDDLSQGTDGMTPWSLGLTYDVNAALTVAGVEFKGGATKLEIALDDMLFAISEVESTAAIQKGRFTIDIVPEPTGLALVGLGVLLGALRRRA